MRPILATVIALGLAIAGLAVADKPQAKEHDDKFVLENDHITVWFQGKKPMLRVFATAAGENATTAYSFHFKDVVEYRDVDADGLPSNTEILGRLDLEKASAWEVNQSEFDGGVLLNLTLEAPVKIAGGVLPDDVAMPEPANRTARIGIAFTLRDATASIEMAGENVTLPPSAVKFDFIVEHWPSVDAENARLALDLRLVGSVTDTDVAGLAGAVVTDDNGTEIGAFSWVETAEGVNAAGEDVEVPVEAKIVPETNATRIVLTYDAPSLVSLVHDPVLGVASTAALTPGTTTNAPTVNPTPGAGALLVVGAVGAVALVTRRRKA